MIITRKTIGIYILATIGAILMSRCKKDNEVNTVTSFDFPFSANVTSIWQIGYSQGDSLSLNDFQPCTIVDTSTPIWMWHPSGTQYYPYIAVNRASNSHTDVSNSWALRPGEIAMEGSNTGQYSLLRLVVPATGKYRIRAVFEGVHFRLSSTDVHILLNSVHLFNDTIEGYGGDPAFHAVVGAHPATTYDETMQLQQNDIVTFAIGYGTNKTDFNDTTGLILSIEKV